MAPKTWSCRVVALSRPKRKDPSRMSALEIKITVAKRFRRGMRMCDVVDGGWRYLLHADARGPPRWSSGRRDRCLGMPLPLAERSANGPAESSFVQGCAIAIKDPLSTADGTLLEPLSTCEILHYYCKLLRRAAVGSPYENCLTKDVIHTKCIMEQSHLTKQKHETT